MSKDKKFPKQYMCIDGGMRIVAFGGQFVTVRAYQDLLRRYKKLLKLMRIKGVVGSLKPSRKKADKIFGGHS